MHVLLKKANNLPEITALMMNSLFAMVLVDRPWTGLSSGIEQPIGAQATIEDQHPRGTEKPTLAEEIVCDALHFRDAEKGLGEVGRELHHECSSAICEPG
ncbi:hypothetical protein MRX96_015445 [Rhipicephalus microplus]